MVIPYSGPTGLPKSNERQRASTSVNERQRASTSVNERQTDVNERQRASNRRQTDVNERQTHAKPMSTNERWLVRRVKPREAAPPPKNRSYSREQERSGGLLASGPQGFCPARGTFVFHAESTSGPGVKLPWVMFSPEPGEFQRHERCWGSPARGSSIPGWRP